MMEGEFRVAENGLVLPKPKLAPPPLSFRWLPPKGVKLHCRQGAVAPLWADAYNAICCGLEKNQSSFDHSAMSASIVLKNSRRRLLIR